MNKFLEITVKCTHESSELVADILMEHSEMGVAVSDIQDVIDLEKSGRSWDYCDEKVYSTDATVLVKGFIPFDEAKEHLLQIEKSLISLKENCPFDVGSLETQKREIDGDLWHEQWKEHFKPIHIGNIVIVPEWIKYQKAKDEIIVYLDSNMAFGTGEHETTSMCVEFLGKYVKKDDVVLDVGCGSGILGITASKLGAKKVIMTDIDECAIIATKHNMQINDVANGEVLLKNLLDDNTVKGEVIVCNIMAEALIAFAPFIGGNLKPNGTIILSGILIDRIDKVKNAYLENGFTFIEQQIKGEWSCLAFSRS